MSVGILGYGTYLPRHRLARADLAAALGGAGGRGQRSVAAHDEDSTTLAVEAGRRALAGTNAAVAGLWFATTSPAYADKTNATAVHAALQLDVGTSAFDVVGAVRSTCGAMVAGMGSVASGPQLVVAGDIRTGRPGSADERDGGDGAGAVLFGADGPLVATLVARGSATAEFLDRWRSPGEADSTTWEDRFGEFAYGPLARSAVDDALSAADLKVGDLDRIAVTGTHARAAGQVRRWLGVAPEVFVDDLGASVGNTGAAHPLLLLAGLLDAARPGDHLALVVLADGAECFVFQATDGVVVAQARSAARPELATSPVGYVQFLTWRDRLRREPPRRPDPDLPVAPASLRESAWKFGFQGSRCNGCGTLHLPPSRVCAGCGAVDDMAAGRPDSATGTVVVFTLDHLAFSPDPPMKVAVVDLDGGGRVQCEVTDLPEGVLARGDQVEMTFRRSYTVDGVHNYGWKARPLADGPAPRG